MLARGKREEKAGGIVSREERRSGKQKFIMANLVYGDPQIGMIYPNLWLEHHLKSLMDQTNIPALIKAGYDVEYAIFSDSETIMQMRTHPNFIALSNMVKIDLIQLNWPPDAGKFESRYPALVQMFHQVLPVALDRAAWCGVWVADLVFAKHALPRMLKRLEDGHDAVFMVPIRSAAESVSPMLMKLPGAPDDLSLFEMAKKNLHHLWVAADWDASLFSKFPYSMVWRSETGLVVHNFGITPIVFKAHEGLKKVTGVIDADVPSFFKNPFWATDWIDAPVAGVEPTSNGHYPPFLWHKASVEGVIKWARHGGHQNGPAVHPVQIKNLHQPLFYPSEKHFANDEIAERAAMIAGQIKSGCEKAFEDFKMPEQTTKE